MTTRFDEATVAKLKSKTYAHKLEGTLYGIAHFMSFYDLSDGFDKNPRAIADPHEQWVEVGTSITMYGGRSYATVGYIASYSWDWKDNTANSSGVSTAHTYRAVGDYYGTLKVTDSGGRVGIDTFVVHATVAGKRVVYAAEEGGRGYVTIDGGETWRTLILDSLAILSTAADPVNQNRGYWGGQYGYVFATRDAGLTCAYSVSLGSPVKVLAVDQINTAIVWAGCQNGRLWKSSNYARNFTEIKAFTFPIYSITIDPTNSNRIVVCGGEVQAELYLTEDGGQTWTDLGSLMTSPRGTSARMVQLSTLTVGPLYLAIFGGTSGTGIKRGNINELNVPFTNSSGLSSDNILDVSGIPGNDLYAYALVENSGMIWRTLNGQVFSQRANVGVVAYSIRSDIKDQSWIGGGDGVYKGFGGGTAFVKKLDTTAKINQVALGPLLNGEVVLYFTPGGDNVNGRGELWKLTVAGVLSKVWTATRDWEGITCIWWSQINDELYFATFCWDEVTNIETDRVYRFNRSTNVASELCSYSAGGWTDPIVDAAEFDDGKIYLHCAYWIYPFVLRFDPVAETLELVFEHPDDGVYGRLYPYTGGIAVDPNIGVTTSEIHNHGPDSESSQASAPYDDEPWTFAAANRVRWDDNWYAELPSTWYDFDLGEKSEVLWLTDFDFNLPATATITGIKIRVNRGHLSRAGTGPYGEIRDCLIQLIMGGALVGANKADTGTAWPNNWAFAEYGGAGDTWGVGPTAAQVNAGNFGVGIAVEAYANNSCFAKVDWVEIVIYYTVEQKSLISFGGYQVFRSLTGDLGSWFEDADLSELFNSADSFSLITHKGDSNYIYAGLDTNPVDDVVVRRTAPGTWAIDLNYPGPSNDTAIVSFTVEYDLAGTVTALYALFWNWWGDPVQDIIYRKPVGGVWALDWASGSGMGVGVACQGLQQGPDGKIYCLLYSYTYGALLYRRDGAGVWTLVQQFDGYDGVESWFYTAILGMALAPNNLFKCHEV